MKEAEIVRDLKAPEDRKLSMRVTYANGSPVGTLDVIQVYVDAVDSPYRTPNPRLCGFLKVNAPAHCVEECVIRLDEDTLKVVDDEGERVSGGGRYVFYVSTSGPDARSRELTGKEPVKIEIVQ